MKQKNIFKKVNIKLLLRILKRGIDEKDLVKKKTLEENENTEEVGEGEDAEEVDDVEEIQEDIDEDTYKKYIQQN